jgi:hypothetical protein
MLLVDAGRDKADQLISGQGLFLALIIARDALLADRNPLRFSGGAALFSSRATFCP